MLVILLALLLTACDPAISITIGGPATGVPAQPETVLVPTPTPRPSPPAAERRSISVPQVASTGSPGFAWLRLPPATKLSIPAIDLTVPVQQIASAIVDGNWIWPVPLDLVGHHLGTANPGEPGNVVISGHVETQSGPGIFARLVDLKPGDILTLVSDGGEFTYEVETIAVVPQDDISVLFQAPDERVTLITCLPDGVFDHRIIVRASRV